MDNKIIVDNVDVSSCKSFCENYGEYHQGYWEDNEICYLHNNHCSDNKDCYYKQLLAEQTKNKKLVEALEKTRWYKAISKDVHKIQQIAAHAVTGIDVLENGLRGLEVNNAK